MVKVGFLLLEIVGSNLARTSKNTQNSSITTSFDCGGHEVHTHCVK
jgi:hypothetical protein